MVLDVSVLDVCNPPPSTAASSANDGWLTPAAGDSEMSGSTAASRDSPSRIQQDQSDGPELDRCGRHNEPGPPGWADR